MKPDNTTREILPSYFPRAVFDGATTPRSRRPSMLSVSDASRQSLICAQPRSQRNRCENKKLRRRKGNDTKSCQLNIIFKTTISSDAFLKNKNAPIRKIAVSKKCSSFVYWKYIILSLVGGPRQYKSNKSQKTKDKTDSKPYLV